MIVDLLEQLLIAATIDSFFRRRCGSTAWQRAHADETSWMDRVMAHGGRPMADAFDRADAVYGQPW